MTTQLVSRPYHLPRDGGAALWHLGAVLTFKATSEQTAGRMWAKELLAPRGMATPVHRHSREDEAFYVLDGEVSVYVGDQVVRAGTGDFLWAPREVPHAFCVESTMARLLVVSTPAGFEKFFFDTGEPAAVLMAPPPATEPPDLDALVAAPRWRQWAGPSIRESTWVTPTTDGVGAVRKLGRRPIYTLETITEFERPHRTSYTVAGLPVRDYRCTVGLAPVGDGTEIRWSGRFTAPRLLGGPLRALLSNTVRRFAAAAAAAAAPSTYRPT